MHEASGGNYWQSNGDPRGWRRSPLRFAASEGYTSVVELLLARVAAVNATSKYGDTPLHFAITHGNTAIIVVLYKAGADGTIETDDGNSATPLGAKIGINFSEVVQTGGDWQYLQTDSSHQRIKARSSLSAGHSPVT
jgi:ankyrin repeat protein